MSEQEFYADYYDAGATRQLEWRALGAREKAARALALIRTVSARPESVAEVGCGDGAVLEVLRAAGAAERLVGFEISRSGLDVAAERLPDDVELVAFDGRSLPAPDGAFPVAVLTHVLEHAEHPVALLSETARVARAVVLEVPLEDKLTSRRAGYRRQAAAIGHIQRFSLRSARALVASAGLVVQRELITAQPLHIRLFWADSAQRRALARGGWLVQRALGVTAPPLARQLVTHNYTALCEPSAPRE